MRLVPTPTDVRAMWDRSGDTFEQVLTAAPRLRTLLADVETLLEAVGALVRRIETTRVLAEELIARLDVATERITTLVDGLEPSLRTLQPTLQRLADTTTAHEVEAMVSLVDTLPQLVEQIDRDVLPVMSTLSTVAPDLHNLLESSQELNLMLAKVPGMGRIRRRIEERLGEDGGDDDGEEDDAEDATEEDARATVQRIAPGDAGSSPLAG